MRIETFSILISHFSFLARVAPGDQPLDRLQVPRRAQAQDKMRCANSHIVVELVEFTGVSCCDPLDSGWIAPYLVAPTGEHIALVLKLFGRAEAMPHIGVLRCQPECHFLTAAPDQDRDG